jgi:nucleoside-diphosphate-sugar epimerase
MTQDHRLLAITGGAGLIGTTMRPFLRERYRLRLIDIRPVADLQDSEEAVEADVSDFAAAERALAGVDAVVHLAGNPSTSATWSDVRRSNIDGTFNVFEAARRTGAHKVVFASTNHVMGLYNVDRQWPIDVDAAIRPDSLYGVSKAFGESLARYFADAFDMSMICIRIGWFTAGQPNAGELNALWISPRDMAQLVGLALETPRGFGIYNGTSNNSAGQWELRRTREELGYAPQDDVTAAQGPGGGPPHTYVDPRAGILRAVDNV